MLRVVILLPVLLMLAVFALSNPTPIRLGLWPTDFTVQLPMSLAILVAAAVAFLLGAMLVWGSLVGARMRARRAEHEVQALEGHVGSLKAELAQRREAAARVPQPLLR